MPRSRQALREEVEVAPVARHAVHADDRALRAGGAPLGVADASEAVGPSTGTRRSRGAGLACGAPTRAIRSSRLQPVDDALAENALRLAADEHADVAAGEADLRVVLGADQLRAAPACVFGGMM